MATTGAIVLFVLGFVGSLYSKVNNFDVDGTVVAMQAHGQRTVMPVYSQRLQAVGQDAVPALTEALRAEAEALLPRVSDSHLRGGRIPDEHGQAHEGEPRP